MGLLQAQPVKKTKSSTNQKFKALQNQLEKIKEVLLTNKEVILIGDINLDMMAINLPENVKTQTQKSQNPLMALVKCNLTDNGMKLTNKEPTFFRQNGIYKSQLDIIMTNKINKISEIIQVNGTLSDHDVIGVIRKMKITNVEEIFYFSRDLNKLNPDELNSKVINH